MRSRALTALACGAVGSLGLTLQAGRRSPRFLLVLFVGWVLLPFVALAWASVVSKRWPVRTRATLQGVIWIIAMGSLAIYGDAVLRPRQSTPTATFLLVPLASWLLMMLSSGTAAWTSRQPKPKAES